MLVKELKELIKNFSDDTIVSLELTGYIRDTEEKIFCSDFDVAPDYSKNGTAIVLYGEG